MVIDSLAFVWGLVSADIQHEPAAEQACGSCGVHSGTDCRVAAADQESTCSAYGSVWCSPPYTPGEHVRGSLKDGNGQPVGCHHSRKCASK